MKIPLLLLSVFAVAVSAAGGTQFRCTSLAGEEKEALLRMTDSCPVLRLVESGARPWRLLASAVGTIPLLHREIVEAEDGSEFLVEYPVGEARLFLYDGDVYGEIGEVVFLLPESELLKQALEASPEEPFAAPLVREAFNRLANMEFSEWTLPENFKSEYSARVTRPSLRRGCTLPEPFSAAAVESAVKSGANLLRFAPGENPLERLNVAQSAGVPVLLDCSALPTPLLAGVTEKVKAHPALAGIDLGAAPDILERAGTVRARAEKLPLFVAPAPFGEGDDFREFRPLPLADVSYTVSIPRSAGMAEPVLEFQRRYGARIFLRAFDAEKPKRFIDEAEKNGWEWVVPAPTAKPYADCFRRNRK